MSQATYEKICVYESQLSCPLEIEGQIYLVSQNGDILIFKDGQLKTEFKFGVEISSIAIDHHNNIFYIADIQQRVIYYRLPGDKEENIIKQKLFLNQDDPEDNSQIYRSEYNLIGPNQVIFSESLNCLFFTDSGTWAETSLDSPRGSLFVFDLEDKYLKPLAYNCLAYPCGLALTEDNKILYVCETSANRVLRLVQTNDGVWQQSVFICFNGRFGPTACVVSPSELLYVARYDFQRQGSDEGVISVINKLGEIKQNVTLPSAPEITGLHFSKQKNNILYATENSQNPCLIRILVQTENADKYKQKDIK